MRLIYADALIEDLKKYFIENKIHKNDLAEAIAKQHTVDAVPVVHAKWIAQNDGLTRFMCSHCKSENHEGFETYCPKCGALMDMRGEKND